MPACLREEQFDPGWEELAEVNANHSARLLGERITLDEGQ
jgi:hypothetical protein